MVGEPNCLYASVRWPNYGRLAPPREKGIRVALMTQAGAANMRHILDMRPDIIKPDIS